VAKPDRSTLSGSEDEQDRPTKHKAKSQHAKTSALKAELKQLLSQPLIAKGISTRYITSGSRPIVDDLIAGECTLSCSVNHKVFG
jgi:ATP-dependent RNA helicase DDX24/MAK5